jgi:molecular chaperone DnaK
MTDGPIIGIDLGTTFSAVSLVREGRPQLLTRGTERLIPSVVGYSAQGKWLVGTPARNQYVLAPENTVRSIKRKMGSSERIQLGGHLFTPQQISAFILREMKQIAETNLRRAVGKAVITVPAYFSDAQRQATKDAGEIAGLQVMRIINEPTAAALAYGLNRADDQIVLVYDLGGGTFDVSLVELTAGVVEVRASHGDTHLGGDDLDERLARYLADSFYQQHQVELAGSRQAMARLTRAAEQAKIQLSDHPFAWVREEYLAEKNGKPLHLEYEVARAQFETMIEDLLQRTTQSIDQVLKDAHLSAGDLDRILLVGGSTRIPAVWRLVAEHTRLEPEIAINPDEAVALGAGVQAAIIAGQPIASVLVDVTPFSLGIEVATFMGEKIVPDMYQPLIRRNTTIPTTKEEVFRTVYPGQESVEIKVYQGEHPIASQNRLLGKFLVGGLKPEAPGEPAKVTVAFDIDVNGILRVQAADRKTGQQKAITVSASHERLSADEITRATAQLAGMQVTRHEEAELAEINVLLNRARQLLEQNRLEEGQAAQLQAKIEEITAAHQTGDNEQLENLLEELLDLMFDVEE